MPSLGTAPRENGAGEQAMARKIDSIWDRFLDPTLATPGLLAKSRWRDHEHHRWGGHYHGQHTYDLPVLGAPVSLIGSELSYCV